MGIEELISSREEILRTAHRHGVRNIRVFGSVVRGETHEDSDIDFLIEVGGGNFPMVPGRSGGRP